MATKLQLITDLYGDTAKQVTDSVDGWKSYLTSAARLYKYSFDEQLLIYAQRPDATACAAMELWNGKMNRWVKPGSKGIALIHKNASGKPHLEYVFDVADTRPVKGAKTPWLWEMHEEVQEPVLARLEARYGETEGSFGDRLMELATRAVGENYREHLSDLTYDMEDSFLEGLDDLNLDVRFRNILTASVQFTLLTRCGLDPSLYLEDEDLQGITEFSTTAVLSHIGNATSDLSGTLLVEIGNAIRENGRNIAQNLQNPLANQPVIGYTEITQEFNTLKRERSIEHGRVDISEERGLSDSQPHDGGNRNGGNFGQIRDAAADLLAGTPERDIHLDADDGQTVAASAGHRPDSTDAGGQHAETPDGTERRERADESHRPDEVGAGSKQPESNGRGNSAERIDLQLTENNEQSGGDKLPDFISTQSYDLLHGLLRHDQFLKAKRPVIADYFEKHTTDEERTAYIKSLYDDAFTGFDVAGVRVGYRAGENGLNIWTGNYLTRTSDSVLHWDVVQGLVAQLMEQGNYLLPEDKPLPPPVKDSDGFTQITLFPSVEQQIEHIAEAQAEEKRSPAFSHAPVLPVPQGVIDRVLSSGGNQWHSIERIVANFQKDRTGSAHENFIKEEYGRGGKGFSVAGKDYAVWFSEDGLRIAPGRTTNVPGCTVVPWIQVVVRIQQLLHEGTFATQEKIDAARPNELKELAENLWDMQRDASEEAEKQGFLPILHVERSNFPKDTAAIAEMLADPIQREAIISEVSEFADAYAVDRNLMHWHHHQPQKLLSRLQALRTEPITYTADPNFEAKRPSFITEDEIDAMLTRGSGVSDGKMRIASYFMQGHESADRARFLREEYGTGGGGRQGYNSDYDSKGLSFTRGDEVSGYNGYDKVHFNWNQVEKRISALIKTDRYLNANEKAYIPEYESLMVARQVYAFFRYAPKDEPQYSWEWDIDAPKRDYIPKLTDPEKAAELLTEMRQIAAFLPPDYYYRETLEKALVETERYVSGNYSLFTPLAPELLQAEREEKQAARDKKQTKRTPSEKQPVDNLAAAARALARKKPSAVKETGNGQLSFDFLSMGTAAKQDSMPTPTVSTPEPDEEATILAAHADEIEVAQTILDERGYATDSNSLFVEALEQLDENPTAEEIADTVEEILLEDEREIARNSYELGYGHMGNGLTVWNRLENEDGDYKTIAHISPDRTVKYYDAELPDFIKAQIEEIAATSEMTVSATQDAPVFHTPPTQEPRTPETALNPDRSRLSVDLFVAFQTSKMDSWQTNIPKQQRIKSALYQILKDKNETERTFNILYNNNPINAAELQKYLDLSYRVGDEVTFTFDGVTNAVTVTEITEDDVCYRFADLEQEPVLMARHEFEKYLVQGQAVVLNQAHTMTTTNEQPAPTKPMGEGERAIKDVYSKWLPVVVSRVLDNETYQNACRNSDEQNARTELYALLDKTALDIMSEDNGFYNLYTNMPAFHNRLRQEVFEKTYEVLSTLPEQASTEKSVVTLYRESLSTLVEVVRQSPLYPYLRDHETDYDTARDELETELAHYLDEIGEEQPTLYDAYNELPLFREWLVEDILERTYQDVMVDQRDAVERYAANADAPDWARSGMPSTTETQKERDLAPLVDAYLNLKAQHPDRVIGVQVGDHILFYGKDAETAAPALGSNLLTREIPGLGETAVTGSTLGWQSNLVSLLNSGHSVLFVSPSEENPAEYEIIKERTTAEYIPIGMELTIDGRSMQIDSVDFSAGTVSLRDMELTGWFPIFRSESIPFVRSFIEEQQTVIDKESLPPQLPDADEKQQIIDDRQEKPLEPIEIEGGKLIDVVIDLRAREIPSRSYDDINQTLKTRLQSVEEHPKFPLLYEDYKTWAEYRNGDNPVGHNVVDWIDAICKMSTKQLNDYLDDYTPGLLNAHEYFNFVQERRNTSRPNRQNFHITDDNLGAGGQKTKYQANIAAIRTLKQIEAEKRLATPEEQETLSRYVGWGGIADAFDSSRENWSKEYAELKDLLTPEEYQSAQGSVLNAHYTSPTVIRSMYQAVEQMGLNPGNILEPAMGVGNFFGLVPESMQNSRLYGVELDSLTGRIAKQLYQKADITISGFEKTDRRDFYDLAVGNVPFGQYKVSDKPYDKLNFPIHDYFLAKSIDQLRPGGIMAVVTSHYTMDKQNTAARAYLAKRADLLGAIRLPNNAFKQNAGTEVTSDILFFQKRDHAPEREPEWVKLGETVDGITVNRYFADNPHMILGEMVTQTGQFGTEITCQPITGEVLADQLAAAVKHLAPPDKELLTAEPPEAASSMAERESIPADPDVRNYSFALVDGELYFRENSRMKPVELGKTPTERVKGMLAIRDCARRLIDLQLMGAPESEIEREQVRLNVQYDSFTKSYGLLNSLGNKQAFESDSSYPLLCSLEILNEEGKLERKADMFTKRTIQRHTPVTSVDTAAEALAVSIGEKACVDLGYMASLMGGSDKLDTIIKDLQGVIFKDPTSDQGDPYSGWQAADEYLSGNVRQKLAIARAAAETAPEYAINVDKLEQVQPKELSAAEIDVRIGATWIEPKYYKQFMFELLQTPKNLQDDKIDVRYAKVNGEWNIQGKSADSKNNARANATYGTKRRNAYMIIEDSLNLRDTRIYDTVYEEGTEKRVLNPKETAIAQQKQEAIGEAFKDWIWKDPQRREELSKVYNEIFNSTRPREYDGQHIRYTGMNPEIHLRTHQNNAVAHMLYGNNTLLAHCVGAGKTFEMIAAAMESKRLGLAQKSLFVVPNHLTEQWGGDFLRLYPGANVLVATKKDFEPKNRKKFCARIATGDYDAVVIGHSQFEKIPLSPERQKAIIDAEIDEVIEAIEDAKEQDGERYTIKQLEKTRKNLEARLEKLMDNSRKDSVVTFEELGVDRLFVDEAHYYKNLFLHTKMRNVAGIGQSEAQKSSDMFGKCRYMDELTGGKGVTFATGTPVSNSMVELYTMMRYLQFDTLQACGLGHFDEWAAAFGEKVTAIELAPEGTGFRSKTRFAKFFNLPELINLWKEAADIQTADMLKLPVPTAEYITVTTDPSEHQQAMVASLAERAEAVRNRDVEPNIDNMLKITSDGRKLALDQRLHNDLLPDDPESKTNTCVGNIFSVWQDTTDIKGTQLVFCDLSTPHYDGTFNVYDDIKNKLMEKGIPPEEIAFIHDANTENQKAELFAKVRKGQIRVLLGSTAKMGAGTNVQDRLVALHHTDCPWRPADIEQREGRILRQGNLNKSVKIFKYVTKGTFDAYNWGLVENKQKFIGQIMTSKSPARSAEDIDATALSYAEVKALATGDDRIREKMDLDIQVAKLKLLKSNHNTQKYEMEDKVLKFYPQKLAETQLYIECLTADLPMLETHPVKEDAFSMTVMGALYTDRKEAGEAIIEACKTMTDPDQKLDLGEYRGFPMKLSLDGEKFKVSLKQNLTYTAELSSDPSGNITRINNALEKIPENLDGQKTRLVTLQGELESAKEEAARPFPKEEELSEKVARLTQLNIELDMGNKGDDAAERGSDEDTPPPDGKTSIIKALKQFEAPPRTTTDREQAHDREAI